MIQLPNPLVSTIVLSYNQSRFLLETLESVKAQTYKATQLIIVDDCSSDDSVATIGHWLQENGIRCAFIRHQQNEGICKSLNDALAVANGKYISIVASDDVWLPGKIERQVEIMESQPDYVGVLYSDALQMDENGHVLPGMLIAPSWKLPEMPQGQVLNTLLQGNFIPGLTTLIRRSCYDEVGLYDENLPWEDWDMWMRIARHYSFIYSPTPSAKYRHHEKSLSHSDPGRMLKDSFKIGLKQFRLGHLNEDQKSTLIGTLLNLAGELYNRNDSDASDILLDLWQATGNKRAVWMYRFARLGVSFRNLQRADACRIRLRCFLGKLVGNDQIL
jgi:glycosyltransferase involved in cell wall biosynthesis